MSAAPTQRTSPQPHEIALPRLSDSMEEATVVEWLVGVGDEVSPGDEIAMIETDKATVPLEADGGGTLTEIVVAAGETAPMGAVLARLGGVAAPAGAKGSRLGDGSAPAKASPTGAASPPGAAAASPPDDASGPPGAASAPAKSSPAGATSPRAKASPVARRIARQYGIDLHSVAGNGPQGRIVKADVEALIAGLRAPEIAVPVAAPAPAGDARGAITARELTRLQLAVARRMAEAKSTVPDFVVRTEVDMAAAAELRESLKALVTPAPSFNDMVVKACALTLREMPIANGSFADGRYLLHERVNVGVAVAGEGTLVVPTVFDADTRSLGDIARATRALAEKVRDGSVGPRELEGGTFTVSNLGMFGVTGFTAVINPPQAAILAVGAVRDVPVVLDGAVVPGKRMEIALTCDHRILYGADAARFVGRVRELLEQPLSLAL